MYALCPPPRLSCAAVLRGRAMRLDRAAHCICVKLIVFYRPSPTAPANAFVQLAHLIHQRGQTAHTDMSKYNSCSRKHDRRSLPVVKSGETEGGVKGGLAQGREEGFFLLLFLKQVLRSRAAPFDGVYLCVSALFFDFFGSEIKGTRWKKRF